MVKCRSISFIMMHFFSLYLREFWLPLIQLAQQANACTTIDPPPPLPPSFNATTTKFVVLINRYDCNFDIKVSRV